MLLLASLVLAALMFSVQDRWSGQALWIVLLGLLAYSASVAVLQRRRAAVGNSIEAEEDYPGYAFARHKGYPTKAHVERLRELGPCPIHRRSFAPVAQTGMKSPGGI